MEHRVVRLPKARGRFREIYIVPDAERHAMRGLLEYLEGQLSELDRTGANYAFQRGRNCALNALQHVGFRFTLSLDLESFFDSVTRAHLEHVIHDVIIDRCFIDGAPRQGLPTSPLLATIAFLRCDWQIDRAVRALGVPFVYTRYADDLAFSFDERRHAGTIAEIVTRLVAEHGFRPNRRKQRLQDGRNGRRIITGIGVDDNGIHATRRVRKRLRAALHQGRTSTSDGLSEWSKCKLPNASLCR